MRKVENGITVSMTWKGQRLDIVMVPAPMEIEDMPECVVFLSSVATRVASMLPSLVQQQFQEYVRMGQAARSQGGRTPVPAEESHVEP